MAKKNKGNQIQRRNVTPKVPELHKNNTGAATKKNLPVDEDPALQNSFNYTMYGMLIGASIGYFAGNLPIGFGIGMLAGGVVDSYLNSKKKKKREAILKAQAEKKQKWVLLHKREARQQFFRKCFCAACTLHNQANCSKVSCN